MNGRRIFLFAVAALMGLTAMAQRTETVLKSWRFSHQDGAGQEAVGFNDKKWEQVSVPHDWAIAGPFDKEIDKQVVAIVQNGEKEATEKTGRSGSLPWIGTGWYRTHVDIDPKTERALLNFDGAMAEPVVYVNGKKAGEWKYGYSAFNIDITPYINRDGKDNVIAVRLENVEESSRWYPGAGIYRPVKLITTQKAAIKEWSVWTQPQQTYPQPLLKGGEKVSPGKGREKVSPVDAVFGASVVNGKHTKVSFAVLSDGGDTLAVKKTGVHGAKSGRADVSVAMKVKGVELWSPENPKLYTLVVDLMDKKTGSVIDTQRKKIGFRTVEYSKEKGFALNGVSRKFKGVCLHHDLGMIGAAVNKSALIRQVELLKSMGCDAIRTSHNMPSQMQMDVCDSLGMMVMAESFDMWVYPKCKNGYARFFESRVESIESRDAKTWAEADIENLVMANRLHPSVVMWSIGNEIPEQGMKDGAKIVRHLQNIIHDLDPDKGRMCTTGMDRIDNALKTGFAQVIDIPGMNYRTHKYEMAYKNLGHGFVLGSETASTVSSRGVYKFSLESRDESLETRDERRETRDEGNAVERYDNKAYDDGQCSSYDTEACWWANVPEDDWILQDDRDWVIGEFVWTGFDYLGEPTPYDEYWPSRSSYFGIFDLAGLPKDRYYLYRSRWNTKEKTIHLLPHWTWPGREGKVTPVYCYSNYPTAELFVNGKSQGRITKQEVHRDSISTRTTDINDPLMDRYRLRWNNVKYEPGEVKVVVYDAQGNKQGEETIRTAGKPAALQLSTELGEVITQENISKFVAHDNENGKGDDALTFITVNMVDKDGNLCPDADNQIVIETKGDVQFRGICNGDATSLEVFTKPTMKLFHGQLVFAVHVGGKGSFTVKAKGMKSVEMNLP